MIEQQGDKKSIFYSYTLKDALNHRRATSYGAPIDFIEKCSCCNRPITKSNLSLCFNQSQLFYCGTQLASYLYLLKSLVLQFLLLGLVYTLPLIVINYKNNGCQTVVICENTFFSFFSVFNSFDSSSSIDLMVYLAIPAVIVMYFLFLMRSRLISSLRIRQQEFGLFPDSCALFLELPFNHLTDHFVISQIETWWEKEAKSNKEYFVAQFAQLKEGQSKVSQLFSSNNSGIYGQKARRQSLLVQEVIFSYNYPQFKAFQNEIQAFTMYFQTQSLINKEEMNTLIKLHQKKKKLLHETAKNKFCLIIFKQPKYAEYFYQKTNSTILQSVFCFETKRHFRIQGESVKVQRGYYPCQLYWHNMHLTSRQKVCNVLLGYTVFVLLLVGSTAGWYGVCKLHLHLLATNSSAITSFIIIVAVFANIIALLISKIVRLLNDKQDRKSYSQQNSVYIIKTTILNLNLLYLSPFTISCILDYSLLWKEDGFLLLSYWMIGMYLLISLLRQYLKLSMLKYIYYQIRLDQTQSFTQKQANQFYQKPTITLQQNVVQLLTIAFLNSLAIPFNPLFSGFSLLWAILFYCTQKINICYLRKEDQSHGQKLILSVCSFLQLSPILLIASCFSVGWVASNNGYYLNTAMIVILVGLALISLIYLCLPIQKLISVNWQSSNKLKEMQYCDLKSNCFELYQKYNNPYLFGTKDSGKPKEYSVRIKIYEQMNTMSKTLTQSLKERLMSYQHPVLNNDFQKEDEDDEVDHIYFEYEKKVEMKNSTPKIQIPRLFKAQTHDWKNHQIELDDKVNINSLFSDSDQLNKRLIKKMIKEKVKKEGQIN